MREHYEHQRAAYYRKDRFSDFRAFFADIDRESRVLNFGCGHGGSLKEFPNGVGIDFNRNLEKLWEEQGIGDRCFTMDASAVPFFDNSFDWSISTDFLEHVQPEMVEQVVGEIARVAPNGKHVIHLLQSSAYRGPNGENLHVSAGNTVFWDTAFESALDTPHLHTERIRDHFLVSWSKGPTDGQE